MNNIMKVGRRNNISVQGKRYNLSKLISESYQTLYNCKLDSQLYKLTESHIQSIQKNPVDIETHSKNLEILKALVGLGESVKILESDIPVVDTIEDEDVIKEDADLEVQDDEDVIDEDADLEVEDDEDVIAEDADLEVESDEDVIDEDAELEVESDEDIINETEEEDAEDTITPEELAELKKHLQEIRKARRTRESAEADSEADLNDPELAECPDRLKKTGRFPESRSWNSEKSSMTKALKKFRESSNKKAFYKSFKKLNESMKTKKTLTLQESILLYKASNSAMTHLTVELEHNPEFIYTFRECTDLLSRDNMQLLECIKKQVSPSKSLLESYRTFSNILLESEDLEDELVEEDEDVLFSDEEVAPEMPEEEIQDSEEENPAEEEALVEEDDESEEGELPAPEEMEESEEEVPAEEVPAEDEIPAEDLEEDEDEIPAEDIPVEETPAEDLEEELEDEITDEEAEALKNKLMELRKSRRK